MGWSGLSPLATAATAAGTAGAAAVGAASLEGMDERIGKGSPKLDLGQIPHPQWFRDTGMNEQEALKIQREGIEARVKELEQTPNRTPDQDDALQGTRKALDEVRRGEQRLK